MKDTNKIYLTEEGLNEVKKELEYLKLERRPQVIEALKEARSLGDLSENAEYDAARTEQAEVESKIAELESIIEHVQIITDVNTDKVTVGTTVKIKYIEDNEIEEYAIVGSKEADPFNNKISNESPIATAIIGHKKGETVSVDSPNGKYEVEIMEISC
ncbi:MAG: transcription elongation factor GreA [Bacilli bacterium]|nr:transcription elongation factor GreA [Bacilli bacterium]